MKWHFFKKKWYHRPNYNQDHINNLNRSVISKELEVVINFLSNKISTGKHGFSTEFYKNFKEEILHILLIFFHIEEPEGILTNSFYKTTIKLMTKPHKDVTKRIRTQSLS